MRTISGDGNERPPREMPFMKEALMYWISPQSQAIRLLQ